MSTAGGGWTVFQRRINGLLNFYKTYEDYEQGFGDLKGEFWLGLEKIHRITHHSKEHSLRVELTNSLNVEKYAKYSSFYVRDGTTKYHYMLEVEGYSGTAGDAMSYNNGTKFSAHNKDNDNNSNTNCAVIEKGAWWYKSCSYSSLNAYYSKTSATKMKWTGFSGIITKTEMKTREN